MDQDRRQRLNELCQKLGYQFKDLELLNQALKHSSYVHEHPEQGQFSYERLEFLGDAVLELVVTELLYHEHHAASEGELSKGRSSLVNEARLAGTARRLSIGEYLLLGRGEEAQGGRNKSSLLADAVEAVVAAVYLDGGLEQAAGMVKRLLEPALGRALERAPKKDFKTRLQELAQESMHVTPRYRTVAADGPDHAKTFTVELVISEEPVAVGSGRSKKEAEQAAAAQALENWDQLTAEES